jgi:hypothetical protein
MEFFFKKQLVFVSDKIVSLKGAYPLNVLYKGFPKKSVPLEVVLNAEKETVFYKKAFPGEMLKRSPPKTIEKEIHPKFTTQMNFPIQERFVLTLKDARVALSECFVITSKGFIIEEINMLMGRAVSRIFYSSTLPELKKINGEVAVISNNDNYFHWMFETIPRILQLKKLGIKPDYYVIGADKKFKKESIKKMGLREKQIISADKGLHITADKLIVPSFPIHTGNPTQLVCDFLRKTFLKAPGKKYLEKYERIYISRGNVKTRKVSNEKEVLSYLSKYGFVPVTLDGLSIEEQAKIFNSAKVIVAPHGAALSNLVFARKGTKVIEAYHPDYVNVCFWALSNCVGLDHYYFMASKSDALNFDVGMHMSIDKLSASLKIAKVI